MYVRVYGSGIAIGMVKGTTRTKVQFSSGVEEVAPIDLTYYGGAIPCPELYVSKNDMYSHISKYK